MSRIYKLERDFVHWQILSLVWSLQRNHVTLLLSRQSLSACKDVGCRRHKCNNWTQV